MAIDARNLPNILKRVGSLLPIRSGVSYINLNTYIIINFGLFEGISIQQKYGFKAVLDA